MADYVCVADFERRARPLLSLPVAAYFYSGADEETTLKENILALQRIRLWPRILRDVSQRRLATTLLGGRVSMPIGIAPTGYHKCASPDGELGTANASQSRGTCYVVSSAGTTTLGEICEACPNSLKWFQVYIYQEREMNVRLIREAEALGFKALVLTVDCPLPGRRRAVIKSPLILPPHIKHAFPPRGRTLDSSITWRDITWLKTITSLPIVVKGVMTPEDAILAVEHGVSALWVSNHGGRQLDTVPATVDMLAAIIAAVGGKVEVYMDGGIRTGTDVFKALALGARAVFIGRPIIWGLACNGHKGVEQVLDVLTEELSTAMALSGCASVDDIDSNLVVHARESKL